MHNSPHKINNVVEGFILLILILFVVIEEADWLCFSASFKTQDLIKDESPWNINRLFLFKSS